MGLATVCFCGARRGSDGGAEFSKVQSSLTVCGVAEREVAERFARIDEEFVEDCAGGEFRSGDADDGIATVCEKRPVFEATDLFVGLGAYEGLFSSEWDDGWSVSIWAGLIDPHLLNCDIDGLLISRSAVLESLVAKTAPKARKKPRGVDDHLWKELCRCVM